MLELDDEIVRLAAPGSPLLISSAATAIPCQHAVAVVARMEPEFRLIGVADRDLFPWFDGSERTENGRVVLRQEFPRGVRLERVIEETSEAERDRGASAPLVQVGMQRRALEDHAVSGGYAKDGTALEYLALAEAPAREHAAAVAS